MELEDYFEFLTPEDIRVKGTRIGIEHILYEYVVGRRQKKLPKNFILLAWSRFMRQFCIIYWRDRETVGKYLENWLDYTNKAQAKFDRDPPAFVAKVLKWKLERLTQGVRASQ